LGVVVAPEVGGVGFAKRRVFQVAKEVATCAGGHA
jgi:hypothetical protein